MSAFLRSHSHDFRQLTASCVLAPVCVMNSVTRWVVSIVPVPVPLPLRVLRCCLPAPPQQDLRVLTLTTVAGTTTPTDEDEADRCCWRFCRQPGGSLLRRCNCCSCCCCRCRLLPSQQPPQQQQQQHLVHPPAPEQQRLFSEAAAALPSVDASVHGRILAKVLVDFLWVGASDDEDNDTAATIRSGFDSQCAVSATRLLSGAILNFCFDIVLNPIK